MAEYIWSMKKPKKVLTPEERIEEKRRKVFKERRPKTIKLKAPSTKKYDPFRDG